MEIFLSVSFLSTVVDSSHNRKHDETVSVHCIQAVKLILIWLTWKKQWASSDSFQWKISNNLEATLLYLTENESQMSWLFFSIFSIILTCVKNGLWNKNIANASKWLTSLYHTMLESYDDSKVLQFRNLWRMPVIFVTVLEVSYEKRSAKSVLLLLKSPRKKKSSLASFNSLSFHFFPFRLHFSV